MPDSTEFVHPDDRWRIYQEDLEAKLQSIDPDLSLEALPFYEVSRATKEGLKEFVLAYCDQKIYTDTQAGRDAHLVFMPLALGALSPPDEVYDLIGTLPDPPTRPEPPGELILPQEPGPPARPAEPQLLSLDPEALEEDWEEHPMAPSLSAGRLAAKQRQVDEENQRRKAHHEQQVKDWEETCKQIRASYAQDCAQLRAEHDKRVTSYDQDVKAYWDDLKAYEANVKGPHDKRAEAILEAWLREVGCLYEFLHQAGLRSINGHPTFFSLRLLHRHDWMRAAVAIERELARRQSDDIFDGL